jgi:hypothetical protein
VADDQDLRDEVEPQAEHPADQQQARPTDLADVGRSAVFADAGRATSDGAIRSDGALWERPL